MEKRKGQGGELQVGASGCEGLSEQPQAQGPQGAAEPRQDDAQPLDEDEVEIIGDLGSEFDDPEGWMSERADYWTDWADPPLPSRAALLRHRIGQFIALLRSLLPQRAPAWPAERVAEAIWQRAVEEVFGPGSLPDIGAGAASRTAAQVSSSVGGSGRDGITIPDADGSVSGANTAVSTSSTSRTAANANANANVNVNVSTSVSAGTDGCIGLAESIDTAPRRRGRSPR